MSFFVNQYETLADYKSVIDRLTTFDTAVAASSVESAVENKHVAIREHAGPDLRLKDVSVSIPNGQTLVDLDELVLNPGESALLTGPSGSGKSTLFRAISGIWPFGRGEVLKPRGDQMLLLPQRPYLPQGSLRSAVSYPGTEGAYDDAVIAEALQAAKLPHLAERLDEERAWAQTLSLGEQQRLAVARALLTKPDWLFLDEATAALDEPTEAEIYRVLKDKLPATTIVSIGHRSTLAAFHDRRLEMRVRENGLFAPVDVRQPIAAQ
jgi:putative ATP-binding cassette transporter